MPEQFSDEELVILLDYYLAKTANRIAGSVSKHEERLSERIRRLRPSMSWGDSDRTPRGVARNAMKFGELDRIPENSLPHFRAVHGRYANDLHSLVAEVARIERSVYE